MQDNDIKKALEDCITHNDNCISRPSNKFCYEHDSKLLMKATLDLINRLEAENEKLKNSLAISEKETKRYVQGYKMACSERNEFLGQLETAKAESYKEFAERLKEKSWNTGTVHGIVRVVAIEEIDNLLKELVEGNNGK